MSDCTCATDVRYRWELWKIWAFYVPSPCLCCVLPLPEASRTRFFPTANRRTQSLHCTVTSHHHVSSTPACPPTIAGAADFLGVVWVSPCAGLGRIWAGNWQPLSVGARRAVSGAG